MRKNFITKDIFLERAIYKHGGAYNYDSIDYKDKNTKVVIICNKCNMEFLQSPTDHTKSKCPCPHCRRVPNAMTYDEAKAKLYKRHGSNIDFSSDTVWDGVAHKYTYKCNSCGDIFSALYSNISRKSGCPNCSNLKRRSHQEMSEIIYNITNHSLVLIDQFINTDTKISMKCDLCGGEHKYSPGKIIYRGLRCSCQRKYGFKNDIESILYYCKLNTPSGVFYKIGITNTSVKERFKEEFKYIEKHIEIKFPTGKESRAVELSILRTFSYSKNNGDIILKNKGNTELYHTDILNIFGDNDQFVL